jgi:hypothetical protein
METEPPSVKSWITEGMIIALIPVTAYLWTLFYEIGFCDYFHIRYYFISLTPAIVLATSGEFILILLFLYLLIMYFFIIGSFHISAQLSEFTSKMSTSTVVMMIFMLYFLALASLMLLIFNSEVRQMVVALAIIYVLLVIATLVNPLFTQRKKEGSYWEKLAADIKPSSSLNHRGLHFPMTIIISIVFIVVSGGASAHRKLGQFNAQWQEEFYIVAQSPELVVIRNYGDYLFAAPFDRVTKEVEKKLYLLKISDMAKTPLTTEKVGPLHIKP